MALQMERSDAFFTNRPHLTNYKGEVLYASLLRLTYQGTTNTKVRYCWVNINNVDDAYFEGLWRQEINELLSLGGTVGTELIYHPVCPDPSQHFVIEKNH